MNRNFSLVMMLALAACVPARDAEPGAQAAADNLDGDPRLGPSADTICFGSSLNGFYEVGDRALVVRRTVGEAYLLRTGHCPNLRSIEGLEFEDKSQCLKRGGRIAVYDTRFPRAGEPFDKPDRCTVLSIHHWREDDTVNASDAD